MEFADNTYPLPGWLLRITEIFNGYFTILLADESKRSIEFACADAELPVKVQECIDWAKQLNADE